MTAAASSVADATRRSPYQGLTPYVEDDAGWFFGRDEWCEVIGDNLRAYSITVLYGASGVGKSSLLRAGLAQRLASEARDNVETHGAPRLLPVVFSAWSGGDPVDSLMRAVVRAADGLGLDTDDVAADDRLGASLSAWAPRIGGPLLVVLDQLEELFLYHGRTGDDSLEEIGAALRRRDPGIHWLLSIRDDALADLDRFEGYVPGLLNHLLRLEHLDHDAAREAIVAPLERWNRVVSNPTDEIAAEPELVEAVLDQLTSARVSLATLGAAAAVGAGSGIEAAYLQLVLTRLWDEETRAEPEGPRLLRLSTLERLGGAERIVRSHLDSTMGRLSPADRDVAAAIFHYLVTPSGTKIAHRTSDLAEYASLPEPRVAEVADRLSQGEVRILRPVGGGTYEIYHDVLAAPILDWRTRQAQAQLEGAREGRRRLRRRLVGVGVVALVVIGILAALLRFQANKANDAARRLVVAEAQSTPSVVGVLTGHTDVVYSARYSRDGTYLVSASADGTARVWDPRRPKLPPAVLDAGAPLVAASFSPDGSLVVTAGEDGRARVWNWREKRAIGSLQANDAGLSDAGFSPNGKLIVCAGDDGVARVWDWRKGTPIATLNVDGVVRSAVFSPDGSRIATASDDGRVRIWDASSWKVVAVLVGSTVGTAYDATFDPDGQLLATAGQDGIARIWDLDTRRRVATLRPRAPGQLRTTVFSPDGKLVATNGTVGNPDVWDWGAGHVTTLEQPGGAESVEFSPDGQTLASANYNSLIVLFSVPR
jgi:roadblock/LC7 domain-containing protein